MVENLVHEPRPAGHRPWPAAHPGPAGCPMCGCAGEPAGSATLRAALPWPIAKALVMAPSLTPRESATFELLGLGYDNRSIARTLSISERTVKRHVTAILAKLRLESRLQAGLVAMVTNAISVQ